MAFNFNPFRRAAPEAAPKQRTKPQPRLSPAMRGAWQGAEMSRLVSSWLTSSVPINQEIAGDLASLRSRARDLAKNSDYIRRFLQVVKTNVVGPDGFRFQSTVLRSSGKSDDPARRAVEAGWAAFSRKGVSDTQRRLSLRDLVSLAVEGLFRDGEAILVETVDPKASQFGISWKAIDPALLDLTLNEETREGRIRMGVETDSLGRVIAYHFTSTDSTHQSFYTRGQKGFVKIPAERVLHLFFTEYADQIRGFPHLAAAMYRLKMLTEYETAELVAARMAASTMGFIERGEDGGSLEGARAVIEGEDGEEYLPDEPTIEAEAGAWHYIENGAKIHQWSGSHAPTAYPAFVKGILRGIASSLGIPYHVLANDLEGVNYSSIRTAVLEEREYWKTIQNFVVENLLDVMFDRWLEVALLNGKLLLPNGNPLPAASIERYRAHSFTGRRWTWVDPLKDLQANKEAIALGLRSRSSIIRELGNDPDEVWREIQEEREVLESLGILNSEPPTPPTPAKEEETDADPTTNDGADPEV